MDLLTTATIVSALVGIGLFLDKVSSNNLKQIISHNLITLNRRSFSTYVAGNALSLFERLFARNALALLFGQYSLAAG